MPGEVKTSRNFARIWCVLGRPWKPASLLLEVAYRAHRSVRALNHLPVLVLVRIRTDCGFRDCERLSEGRTSIPG